MRPLLAATRLALLPALLLLGHAAQAAAAGSPTISGDVDVPLGVDVSSQTPARDDYWGLRLQIGDTITITAHKNRPDAPRTRFWLLDPSIGDAEVLSRSDFAWTPYTIELPTDASPVQISQTVAIPGRWTINIGGRDCDTDVLVVCANSLDYTINVQVTHRMTHGGVIVSLGDSYAAGEANPPYDAGTSAGKGGCHRSAVAWGRLLGASTLLACSGAVIDDLYHTQASAGAAQGGQIAALRAIAASQQVDVVTLTISGNDVGFAKIIRSCRLPGHGDCLRNIDGVEKPKLDALRPKLVKAYKAVKAAAPGAQLVVVGYPDIAPQPGTRGSCGWLTSREQDRIARLEGLLDTALRSAATTAGATYVKERGALLGHELCTPDSWVYPITAAANGNPTTDQQQAHPLGVGQDAMMSRVLSALAPGGTGLPPRGGTWTAGGTTSKLDGEAWTTDAFTPVYVAVEVNLTAPLDIRRAGTFSVSGDGISCSGRIGFRRVDQYGYHYGIGVDQSAPPYCLHAGELQLQLTTSDVLKYRWDATSDGQPVHVLARLYRAS